MEHIDFIAGILGEWSQDPYNVWTMIFRVALAIVLSSIIGCERATKRHPAGLRTFILVAIGSAFAAFFDVYILKKLNATVTFLSAASIIGMATISCNSILFSSKNQLKGLTTSVCLWATGIITLGIGFGLYTPALIGYLSLILCVMLFPNFESRLKRKSQHFEIHLELKRRESLQLFMSTVRKVGLKIDEVEYNPSYASAGIGVYTVKLTILDKAMQKKRHSEIIEALASLDDVIFIEEIIG